MKSHKLKNEILIKDFILIFVSMLLVMFTILLINIKLMDDIEEHSVAMVEITEKQIKNTIELPLSLMDGIDYFIRDSYTVDSEIVTDYLEMIIKAYPYFNRIHIMDKDRIILNTVPYNETIIGRTASYEPYYTKVDMGNFQWSKVYSSSNNNQPTINVSIAIEDYIITAEMNLAELPFDLSNDDNEISNIAILDQWGTYIISEDFLKVRMKIRYPGFDNIKSAIENGNHSILDKGNAEFSYLESMGWYVVYDVDNNKVYGPIKTIIEFIFILWLVFTIILVCISYRSLRRIRIGIKNLQSITKKIINGDYHVEKMEYVFEEFDNLQDDFVLMSNIIEKRENQIKDINLNLEYIVAERTNELQDLTAQLEEEIGERIQVEEEITRMNDELDHLVSVRTRQLESSNKELLKNIRIAEEANEAKSQFLAVMSHEMRTPLNGIIGFIQMLELSNLYDEQKELVTIIRNSSKTLLNLINDVLDLAKYQADKATLENIDFNLEKMISEVVLPFQTLAKQKGLSFDLRFNTDTNIEVNGDPYKLTQVFSNLLSNALKFTSKGNISVDVCVRNVSSTLMLEVKVTDTGIGISDEMKPYLFKPYTQADVAITRKYGGTGLGLAVCKEIVCSMNGNISFESKLNEGTSFSFNICLSRDTSKNNNNETSIETIQVEKTNLNILVVDDNEVNRKLLIKFLNRYEINNDIATNGEEAIKRFKENNYNYIFMDCQMPIMDGFEATKIIRSLDVSNNIKIIAMTAYATESDRKKCLDAGMDDFLTKPISLLDVARLLGFEKKFVEEVHDYQKTEKKSTINLDKYINNLKDVTGFDYESCKDLIITFKNQGIDIMKSIETMISENDYNGIKNKVHQLKGASGTVRVNHIKDLAEKAEILLKNNNNRKAIEILKEISKNPFFSENGENANE